MAEKFYVGDGKVIIITKDVASLDWLWWIHIISRLDICKDLTAGVPVCGLLPPLRPGLSSQSLDGRTSAATHVPRYSVDMVMCRYGHV